MRVDECGVRNAHLRKTADNIDQGDNMDPASELFIISAESNLMAVDIICGMSAHSFGLVFNSIYIL